MLSYRRTALAAQGVIAIENGRLSAGEKLRSGSGYSRPLSDSRGVMGRVTMPCFGSKECTKSWSRFAETLSKKEIQRPIPRLLGAV